MPPPLKDVEGLPEYTPKLEGTPDERNVVGTNQMERDAFRKKLGGSVYDVWKRLLELRDCAGLCDTTMDQLAVGTRVKAYGNIKPRLVEKALAKLKRAGVVVPYNRGWHRKRLGPLKEIAVYVRLVRGAWYGTHHVSLPSMAHAGTLKLPTHGGPRKGSGRRPKASTNVVPIGGNQAGPTPPLAAGFEAPAHAPRKLAFGANQEGGTPPPPRNNQEGGTPPANSTFKARPLDSVLCANTTASTPNSGAFLITKQGQNSGKTRPLDSLSPVITKGSDVIQVPPLENGVFFQEGGTPPSEINQEGALYINKSDPCSGLLLLFPSEKEKEGPPETVASAARAIFLKAPSAPPRGTTPHEKTSAPNTPTKPPPEPQASASGAGTEAPKPPPPRKPAFSFQGNPEIGWGMADFFKARAPQLTPPITPTPKPKSAMPSRADFALPDTNTLPTVTTPGAPLLDATATRLDWANQCLGYYRGAHQVHLGKRCFMLSRKPLAAEPKWFDLLRRASQALAEHEIAPADWVDWRFEVWLRGRAGGKVTPPGLNYVFNPVTIHDKHGWFESAHEPLGAKVRHSPAYLELRRLVYGYLAASRSAAPAQLQNLRVQFFPPGLYDQLVATAREENKQLHSDLKRRAKAGEWIW